jgi:hypothetical protein
MSDDEYEYDEESEYHLSEEEYGSDGDVVEQVGQSVVLSKEANYEYVIGIRNNLLDYVQESGLPLCEYLTDDLLSNFI